MQKYLFIAVLLAGCCAAAKADVWKWVDAEGQTHFVDTDSPIYTWVDAGGNIHYSDRPENSNAISVELVWVSKGSLDEVVTGDQASGSGAADPNETPEEKAEREKAEAYYCKRATEIYESYVSAPRLYKTNESGERAYLSKEDAAKTIADTRAQKDKFCG